MVSLFLDSPGMQVTSTVEVLAIPTVQLVERFRLDHRRVSESQDQLDKPHAAVAAVHLEPARTPLIIRHGRTRNPICAKYKACMTSTQISNQAIKKFWGLYRNDVVI
jgi:hypothetical protein